MSSVCMTTCNTYRQLIAPRDKLFWRNKSGIWRPLRRLQSILRRIIAINAKIGFHFDVQNFSTCRGGRNVDSIKCQGTNIVSLISQNICLLQISFASSPTTFVYSKYETFSVRRHPRSSRLRAKSRHSHLFQSIIAISLLNPQLTDTFVPFRQEMQRSVAAYFGLLQLFTDGNILLQSATEDHLWYRKFQNKEEVEIAVHEWWGVQKSDFYREGLFKVYQCGQ